MTAPGTVRWGQPPLGFELRSCDAQVLARASVVFRPWGAHTATPAARVWHVDRAGADDGAGWRISEAPGSAPLARDSVATAVRSVEFMAVQVLFEWPSVCTFHGALVSRDGRGVALLGRGESGKSTLACALWQRGWSLLGDDIVIVDTASARAWPAPRRVALREPSRALLGCGLWSRVLSTPAGEKTSEGCVFHPDEVDGRERAGAVPLSALLFLDRPDSGVREPTRLAPAHALLALLPYTNLVLRMDAGALIGRFRPLAERVPAWDLPRRPLDEMVAAAEAALDAAG